MAPWQPLCVVGRVNNVIQLNGLGMEPRVNRENYLQLAEHRHVNTFMPGIQGVDNSVRCVCPAEVINMSELHLIIPRLSSRIILQKCPLETRGFLLNYLLYPVVHIRSPCGRSCVLQVLYGNLTASTSPCTSLKLPHSPSPHVARSRSRRSTYYLRPLQTSSY